MKISVLQIVLVLIDCDEIDNNELIFQEQLNLFQQITGSNTSEVQAAWQRVEQEILTAQKRRSTNLLPKFRLQLTEVCSNNDFQFHNMNLSELLQGQSIPSDGIEKSSKKESFITRV